MAPPIGPGDVPREDWDLPADSMSRRQFDLEVSMSELAADLRRLPERRRRLDRARRAARVLVPRRSSEPEPVAVALSSRYAAAGAEVLAANRTGQFAVVVHLFHPEMWVSHFEPALARLGSRPYDLFVTIPEGSSEARRVVGSTQPSGHVLEMPNHGRDVLPFVVAAGALAQQGHPFVLKLHSKRSAHRQAGAQWAEDLVDKLVPDDPSVLDDLLGVLGRPETSIVGPAGHYLPLATDPGSHQFNEPQVEAVLAAAGVADPGRISARPFHHGFFAGTMFWARLDYLAPLCNLDPLSFEPEAGQTDATLAHGWERAAGALSAVRRRALYEVDGRGVRRIAHHTATVPPWSGYYRGEREPNPYLFAEAPRAPSRRRRRFGLT